MTFNELFDEWCKVNTCVTTGFEEYFAHTCVNCCRQEREHAYGTKCLYDSGCYEPFGLDAYARFHRTIHNTRTGTKEHNFAWGADLKVHR
jgi:hypothetical protein